MNPPHIPILLPEIIGGLRAAEVPQAVWVDGTLGAGGHSAGLLAARADSHLFGFDLDPSALAIARERLAPFGERAHLIHASYEMMSEALHAAGIDAVDGVLLDLGLSSMQLDQAERGFAFRYDAPLDMRFDPTSERPTAAEIVNSWEAEPLAKLLADYGEVPAAYRVALAIIAARPIRSTAHLAEIVKAAGRKSRPSEKIHPATLVFQALRIAVNDELGAVERVLPQAIALLKPGGRLAVISFHSLEDRIVKHSLREAATAIEALPGHPLRGDERPAILELLSRKPIVPSEAEIHDNPRARSAKLRIAEKLALT